MQKVNTTQYNGMIDIATKDYNSTIDKDVYGNYEIESQLVSLYRNKKKELNKQSKDDDIKIIYDKNGYILGGKKLRRQIKNLICELEEQYNLTDPSDEAKLQNLSSRIITLKNTLKKVNTLIKNKEIKSNNKKVLSDRNSELTQLSKSINRVLNENVSDKEKLSNIDHLLEELNELYVSTMFFDEELNLKINDLIMKVSSYKTNMYNVSGLKMRSKKESTKVTDFKVIYDANLGYYKFEYSLIHNGKREEGTKLYQMDKYLLEDVTSVDTRIIEEYGYETAKQLDTNLYVNLGDFDKLYNTNMQEKYVKDELQFEIMYDLRKFSKNLNSYDKKKITELAKNQQKKRNAKLVRFPYARVASVAAIASVAGTMIFSPIIKNITKNYKKQQPSYQIASHEFDSHSNAKSLSLKNQI